MPDPFVLLGGREGALLVLSDQPALAESFAVRVGSEVFPFAPYDGDPAALLQGLDLLAHGPRPLHEPWQVDAAAGATVTRFRNREWTVGRRAPWLLSTAGGPSQTVATFHHPDFGPDIPVVPGPGYLVTARVAALQGGGELRLTFCDGDGAVVAERGTRLVGNRRGGTTTDDYELATVRLAAPQTAATARIEVVVERAPAAASDSHPFLLVLECQLSTLPRRALRWRPTPAAVPELVRAAAGQGAMTVFTAPIMLGVGSGEDVAEVIELQSTEAVASWGVGFESVKSRVRRLTIRGLDVRVRGTAEPVAVYIDGEFVAATPPLTEGDPDRPREVLVPIPERWRDDREHLLQIRDLSGCHLLSDSARPIPGIHTPWDVVQQHATKAVPFERSPAARYRYVSLRRQLARLDALVAAGEATPQDLNAIAQLSRVHTTLERGFEKNKEFPPLTFPPAPNPTVSVVVPVHNKFAVTYHCLSALLLAPNDVDFEVVVVDDGSSDETLQLGERVQGITVVRHEEARGFVGACTSGAAAARGEYLVLLNNDTEPTAGWLDELLAGFSRFDKVGMTGARLLWPDGRVQDAGGLVWENGNPANYGRNFPPEDPRVTYARQVDYVSGAALMIRRSVWDEVGGLSQEYAPAYFEDTDLSFKVRDAGYTTWLIPSSNVFHIEGVSNGTEVTTTSGLKRFQEINRPKFQAKWKHAFVGKGEQGVDPDLEKDRGIRGRVLFIDRAIPQPDKDAGSYAAIVEMRLVQSLGYKVTFLPNNLAHMGVYNDDLLKLGIEVVHSPFASSAADFLKKRGEEFDAVYITRYNVAERVLRHVRQYAPQAKVLFCNADLHFLRLTRAAQRSGDEAELAEAERVREAELDVMREVDVVLSYNAVEHDIIAEQGVATPVVTCPWVVETAPDEAVPGFEARDGIAFLGGYLHTPNVEAVDFFVADVLPKLRERVPGVHFNIYGSSMPQRFLELADDVVHPIGFVETVEQVYDSNRLFIAPLLSGAGIKGKVLGAMAQGIPSVLSPVAAEGTGVVDGQDCVIADSVEDWVDAIASLYDDEERWRAMSASAREFTQRKYGFTRGRELMRIAFTTAGLDVPE